ncbi:FAD-dependent oxidoreductase [Cryobacterium sp. PH29-G1]|uniref:NAD(P)/FAD-dependent oxidoreductase n=1 Tax=Cryobacterium sp. PH29-G1 TaxID=3046211 RepID=UPI0024BB4117|nr:FAD-dependent oxidoreductase [Cryobacterium sp. PH29-G1]MDJ0349267.1 FAD-dependent oxidoreductase [Cryobacterium sp. PH29-G1]
MHKQQFVIVGGGLAGASAAEQLRESGFDGQISLFAAEPHLPYIRPPLSKEYFTASAGRDSIFVHPAGWYADHNIAVTTAEAVAKLGDHTVTLESGQVVSFDRLLVATGSTARRLNLPGAEANGIHYLRTVDDSESLREALQNGDRNVVFVGSGWIGLELAAAARAYGNTVTVVGPEKIPLAGPLGPELGSMFRDLHEANGVAFRLSTQVLGFEQTDGRVSGVITDSGSVPADVVVVGIGAIPNTALAESGGVDIDNGVIVDEHLLSSTADVFAAGDVANAYHPVVKQRMRNEHWANAIAGGKVAARSMLGETASLDDIPYFYTDQYDLGMEYSGYPPLARDAHIVYRGDLAAREFIAFWVLDGVVVAGMNVNVWDVNDQVQQLIRSALTVDEARLTDPSSPLL